MPYFTVSRRDWHFKRTPHGVVALYINNSIPLSPVELNTPLQVVAGEVHVNTDVPICKIYVSRDHTLNQQLLKDLYSQRPQFIQYIVGFTRDSFQMKTNRTVHSAVQLEHPEWESLYKNTDETVCNRYVCVLAPDWGRLSGRYWHLRETATGV